MPRSYISTVVVSSPSRPAKIQAVEIRNARLVSESDATLYLGTPPSFLSNSRRGLSAEEGPPPIHIGRGVAYDLSDLDRWLKDHGRPEQRPVGRRVLTKKTA